MIRCTDCDTCSDTIAEWTYILTMGDVHRGVCPACDKDTAYAVPREYSTLYPGVRFTLQRAGRRVYVKDTATQAYVDSPIIYRRKRKRMRGNDIVYVSRI